MYMYMYMCVHMYMRGGVLIWTSTSYVLNYALGVKIFHYDIIYLFDNVALEIGG